MSVVLFYWQVTELSPEETENPLGGYGRTISHVVIGLKTTKGTKQLRLDPTIYEALQKERVAVGDVIYIEANSGAVKRVGRSDAYATEFDLEVRSDLQQQQPWVGNGCLTMCVSVGWW